MLVQVHNSCLKSRSVTFQLNTSQHERLAAYPSDADHDVARVQVSVHKVVSQQHLEVGVHSQRDNLCVESAGLPNVLGHTLTYKQSHSSRSSHWSVKFQTYIQDDEDVQNHGY